MTQPNNLFPDVAANFASLAAFAAKTQADWEAFIRAPVDFVFTNILTALFEGLETGTSFVLSILSAVAKSLLGLDPTTLFATVDDALAALSGLGGIVSDAASQIAAFLSAAAQATMSAAGELLHLIASALNQIADIFSGASVTPISTAVSQVQDWWSSVGAVLPDVQANAQGVLDAVKGAAAGVTSGITATVSEVQGVLNGLFSGFVNMLQGYTGTYGQAGVNAALQAQAKQAAAQAAAIAAIQSTLNITGSQNKGVSVEIDFSGMADQADMSGVLVPGTSSKFGITGGHMVWQSGTGSEDVQLAPTPTNSDYQVINIVFGPLNDLTTPYGNSVSGRAVGRSNSARTIYTFLDWAVGTSGGPIAGNWLGVVLGCVVSGTTYQLAYAGLHDLGDGGPWLTLSNGGTLTLILGDPTGTNPYAMQLLFNGTVVPLKAVSGGLYLGSHTDASHTSVVGASNRYVGAGGAVGVSGKKPPSIRKISYRDNAPYAGSTPYASAPDPALVPEGYTYYPSDVGLVMRSNGSAYEYVMGGPLTRFYVPPPVSDFGWASQGSAALATGQGTLFYSVGSTASGETMHLATRPLSPTSSYAITTYVEVLAAMATAVRFILGLRNSSSGKFTGIEFGLDTGANAAGTDGTSIFISASKWDSTSTPNSKYVANGARFLLYGLPHWFRLRDDGSIRYYEYSFNGIDFTVLWSVVRTDYITPDQFVLGAYNSSGQAAYMRMRSFQVT